MNRVREDQRPLVSIIMPVRNAGAYLPDALKSVETLTYRNLELIVVDDHSDDKSLEGIDWAAFRMPVKIISLPESQTGVAVARNIGVGQAAGAYVWFVDVDDTWSPEIVADLCEAAEAACADVAICRAEAIWGQGKRSRLHSGAKTGIHYGGPAFASLILDNGALWNKLIRRSIMGVDPFPRLRSRSDHAGIARFSTRVHVVTVIDSVLYQYHRRPSSISNGGIIEPENFLRATEFLEQSAACVRPQSASSRRGVARAVRAFRIDAYARIIREVWRFGERVPEGEELLRSLRPRIRLLHVIGAATINPKASLTCLSFKVAPQPSRAVARHLGKRRWTPSQ